MISIYINRKKYKVKKYSNLLESCLSLGFDIPYFCWHPELGSVGICRQCAVKEYQNTENTSGKIIMSCMTQSSDNISISIDDEEVKQFRKGIIELMMTNHPHDCPVCEEGGNCHLQDMVVLTGHSHRRYRFKKRTFKNQYLGPFISHEMNRCISCYRCVRFYKEYADGTDFGVYGSSNRIYFGRPNEGILQNEFSGNLVEICPTGVFTDKTHSFHYTRKWDMQFSPSICHQCCIGCNISPGERYGEIRRIENRYNGNVNRYFLCDLGRFGYGYVNREDRPKYVLQRVEKEWINLDSEQAVLFCSSLISRSKRTIGIGSARASIESNFVLKELVGEENFFIGISSKEHENLMLIIKILYESGVYIPSLHDIEYYDSILILGEDITQTAARIALAVRQAVKRKSKEVAMSRNIPIWHSDAILNIGKDIKHPLFITSFDCTCLDDISTWSYYAPIEDQARFGFYVANLLDSNSPSVKNFDNSLKDKASIVAESLMKSRRPLIISGSGSGSKDIICSAANIAMALKNHKRNVGIVLVVPSVNSIGISMIGGKSLDDAFSIIEKQKVDSLILMENNLSNYISSTKIDAILENINNLIILDHQKSSLRKRANFIFPSSSFAEGSGTVVNYEGRAQRFFRVYDPSFYDKRYNIFESWRWLHAIRSSLVKHKIEWTNLDYIINEISNKVPRLLKIKDVAPNSNFRVHGQKILRKHRRYSGQTSMHRSIHEPQVPEDYDSMFSFSTYGNNDPNSPRNHIAFAWYPGWNSYQAWNKFQNEIGGSLYYGDPGIRLIKENNRKLEYFNNIPSKFIYNENFRVVPYWNLFGSEETSQLSHVIKERMKVAHVILNIIDAEKMSICDGSLLSLEFKDIKLILPVRLSNKLSIGQIGLTLGFPEVPVFLMWENITRFYEIAL